LSPPRLGLALITLTVMLGTLIAVIDSSIVNVALDTMAGNLGSSPALRQFTSLRSSLSPFRIADYER
jgi:flagellar motor switch protein FliM